MKLLQIYKTYFGFQLIQISFHNCSSYISFGSLSKFILFSYSMISNFPFVFSFRDFSNYHLKLISKSFGYYVSDLYLETYRSPLSTLFDVVFKHLTSGFLLLDNLKQVKECNTLLTQLSRKGLYYLISMMNSLHNLFLRMLKINILIKQYLHRAINEYFSAFYQITHFCSIIILMSRKLTKSQSLCKMEFIEQKAQYTDSQYSQDESYTPYKVNDTDSDDDSSETEKDVQFKSKEKTERFSKKEIKEPKRKKDQENEIQNMIKIRITDKLSNFNNKNLYPNFLGPHPAYTKDTAQVQNNQTDIVQLRTRLTEWTKIFWAYRLNKQNKEKRLKTGMKNRSQRKIQQIEESFDKGKSLKYNKYTLQFKKDVVQRIENQLNKSEGKSLRYYICQEAKFLKIHPKNITRWFETKDLDQRVGGRKAKYPILEFRLARFIHDNPTCKRRKIVEEAKKILIQTGQGSNFRFSKGWYERFKTRMKDQKVERCIERILNQGKQINHKVLYDLIDNENQKITKETEDKIKQESRVKYEQSELPKKRMSRINQEGKQNNEI